VSVAKTLIGGVGYRWQRDASFGVVAADALANLPWPADVAVADLGYGAIYVAQDLKDADPPYDRLILVAGVERGREPGRLYRYEYEARRTSDDDVLARVREAGAGVIDIDHLLVIAQQMNALPREVVIVELEPADTSPGIELSDAGSRALGETIDLVRSQLCLP
jgi:hydrogenase maturation protease